MSNSPVVPSLGTAVQSEVSALAHKQLTVTYSVLAVLVLVLGLTCVGGYFGLKAYEAQVARAEAQEARFDTDRSNFLVALQANETARAQEAKDAADRLAQIERRDRAPLAPTVQAGLRPDATASQAAVALGSFIGPPNHPVALEVTQDSKIALSVPNAQELVSQLVVGERSREDLSDLRVVVQDQNKQILSLNSDLSVCKSTLSEAQKTINDYKKIAVKSGWRKFMDGAEKVGIALIAGFVGHAL